jgi:arylsulfatase
MTGIGRGGTGTLSIDGRVVSTQTMDRTIPLTLPWDETFDIGSKTGTPIDDQDYQVPFPFTGKIDTVTFALDPPKLTPDDQKKLSDAYRAAQDGN